MIELALALIAIGLALLALRVRELTYEILFTPLLVSFCRETAVFSAAREIFAGKSHPGAYRRLLRAVFLTAN